MLIAQILLPTASFYERKSFQIDQASLSPQHEVIVTTFEGAAAAGAALAHLYGPPGFDPPSGPLRYVASGAPRRIFGWRKAHQPAVITSPLDNLPEAVEDVWFQMERGRSRPQGSASTAGTFGPHRPGVKNMVEQTLSRIHRFREDVEWLIFDAPPRPDDLSRVDVWVDPATSEDDLDGFVAEAFVAGKPVVASRTAINTRRLDRGMSGFLVPPRDPNELTHAILGALFKSEVASLKIESARRTAGKFEPRQRLRALAKIYEAVTA